MRRLPELRTFPDPLLRKSSQPVVVGDPTIKQLIELLNETLATQRGGIGIAAPQLGILKQVALVDVRGSVPGAKKLVLINPVIQSASEPRVLREGCMSIPDYTANVKRANRIRVLCHNEEFHRQEVLSTGIEAICIQHEIDHLNGMLFLDRVYCLNTDVFRRKKYL